MKKFIIILCCVFLGLGSGMSVSAQGTDFIPLESVEKNLLNHSLEKCAIFKFFDTKFLSPSLEVSGEESVNVNTFSSKQKRDLRIAMCFSFFVAMFFLLKILRHRHSADAPKNYRHAIVFCTFLVLTLIFGTVAF